MINDPYSVLGISPSASNDEIKRAYRELSRKYHPDSYANNPLSGLAEEKFKEVQEAYDQIMRDRENGYQQSGSSYSNNTNTNSYSNYNGNDAMEFQAAYNYLSNRRYREALNVLAGIPNRNARWFYLSAIANEGIGNNIDAFNHAQQAANMEPGNREYRDLVNQMQFRNQRYQTRSYNYGNNRSFGTGNLCCDLWCADSLCECMGGDLISCM
ncbi:J domain-containing protein [Anaeromicropila herbilytica]|uniref:Molecular chaperone n=1 Tax=Anaeromicropila herbilytica TaxID=2785025 RepID=A0A7R7ELB1_9FIRM|nr:J domain-containing protein [Anaeromicropila herbilytica]BCN30695.1 molecular chaperone [Anaeromicropila herbilytica]